jgi:outer membrane protein OmpA-like peptidoglycan-associated protein
LKRLRETEALLSSTKLDESQLQKLVIAIKPFIKKPQVASLEEFFQQAARIDPDDPPAVLKRALAFAEISGKEVRPGQISVLAPLAKTEKQLREFQSMYEAAMRVDPKDPLAALKKGIEAFEQATLNSTSTNKDVAGTGENNWPPIITLSEADDYFFATGKAELRPEFELKLRDEIVPLLNQLTRKFRVDIIEVTGHTDEQAIVARNSNLDQTLLGVLKGGGQVSSLIPSDNAGLGLARAVAVARILMGDERMSAYRILPMSGGQLIEVGERVAGGRKGDVKERRRIEIRLRRSQQMSEARPVTFQKSSATDLERSLGRNVTVYESK